MALFNFGKDKSEGGTPDLVMAYLEDAQRVRSPFTVRDGRKVDHTALLQALDEKAGTLNLQVTGSFPGEKGAKAEVVFIHENLRLGASMKVVEIRGSTLILAIPDELELLERRKQSRARLNAKEGATLTGLSSLFEGVGINGILDNLSGNGCRVRVEKAMNLKDQKKLGLGTALVSVGHAFMILKLNKVPRCPAVMEMAGKVAYIDDRGGGLALGLILEKSDYAGTIRSMVSGRAGNIPSTVPPKVRRKAVAEEPDVPANPRSERTEKTVEAIPASQQPEPLRGEVAVSPGILASPAQEAAVAEAPNPNRNVALLRLKKRSRAVVILASAGHGELLRDHLLDEGYGRVLVAMGWDDVVVLSLEPGVGLLLIDTLRPMLESMEMVQRLHEAGLELPPIVLAAEEVSVPLVLAAQRVGISQLLVKPYALDESLSVLLEQQMGLG